MQDSTGGRRARERRQSRQSQAGEGRPTDRPAATGGPASDGSHTTVRAISAVFALFGVLSLYSGFQLFRAGSVAPVYGFELRAIGLGFLGLSGAYLYATYGLWTVRLRGWQVGMGLVCVGAFLSVLTLRADSSTVAVVGLLVHSALGWGLHTSRDPFRDGHPESGDRAATTTTAPSSRERTAQGAAGENNRERTTPAAAANSSTERTTPAAADKSSRERTAREAAGGVTSGYASERRG